MSGVNPWGSNQTTGGKLSPIAKGSQKGSGSNGNEKPPEPPPGTLTVTVCELAKPNKALQGITVEIKGPQPDTSAQKKETPRSGEATFASLKPGVYDITVKSGKTVTERITANVDSDKTTTTPVQVRPAMQLKIHFCQHVGKGSPSVEYELWAGGKKLFSEDSFTGKVEIPFTDKNGDSTIDETLKDATLVVQMKRRGVRHGKPQKIQLHFDQDLELKSPANKLDPAALQRLLTNLGYAPGPVDGAYPEATRAAIRAFQADFKQTVSGIPDYPTLSKLVESSENPLQKVFVTPDGKSAPFDGGDDPDIDPALGKDLMLKLGDNQWYEKGSLWDQYDGYIDRAAPTFDSPAARKSPAPGEYRIEKGDETGLKLFDHTRGAGPEDASFGGVPVAAAQRPRFFPTEAFVKLAEKGDDKWKNAIWMKAFRTAFMDCGGWVTSQRSFGIILGWHAYLCEYVPQDQRSTTVRAKPIAPSSGAPRMDHKFFSSLGDAVKVKQVISTVWGQKTEFDWDTAFLIFPDFHLMTAVAGNCWKANSKDSTGPFYDLGAEIDFFDFVQAIVAEPDLQANLRVIQLGDTYDLWVGSPTIMGHKEPLYTSNKTSSVKLRPPSEITFPEGGNYTGSKKEILERWAGCVPEDTDVSTGEMSAMVLQWWIRAVQGYHDTPLEVKYANKPGDMNWVEWTLGRRALSTSVKLADLIDLDKKWRGKEILGSDVAKHLKENYPEQYDNLPEQPTIIAGKYVGFEPKDSRVRAWLSAAARPLQEYDKRCKAFVDYVVNVKGGQWLNPSEAGLLILEGLYGQVEFIYGNHDNYMILPDVVGNVTSPRCRYIECKGVFIEHAQRMEPSLAVGSANYDGCWDGFDLTNNVWRDKFRDVYPEIEDKSGKLGKVKDYVIHHGEFMDPAVVPLSQTTYKNEAGRFLVGRHVEGKQLPHIFVIGHTHGPIMHLNYVHLNDASDIKGPGTMVEG